MIQWIKKLFKKKPVQAMVQGGIVKPGSQRTVGQDPLPDVLVGLSTFKPVGPPNALFGNYQPGTKEGTTPLKCSRVGLATAHSNVVKTHDARQPSSNAVDTSGDMLTNVLLYQAVSNSCHHHVPEPEPERGGYSGGGGASGSWDSSDCGSSSSSSSSSSSDSSSSCSSD